MSLFESMRRLEERGIDLVEILGQDAPLRSPADLAEIVEGFRLSEDDIHVELLHFLTCRRFNPSRARSIWKAIQKHKRKMEAALGRPVRFRVAALDYLHGKTGMLRGVRLVARSEMDALLSYVNVDEVTTVYTRRYFNERLSAELNRARRYGSPLTLLILDLDDFKAINDRFGHLEGDCTLRQVGRLLRENTRQVDIVCRFGGDEFAVILPETSSSEALTLGERIRKAIGRIVVHPPGGARGLRAPPADAAPAPAGLAEGAFPGGAGGPFDPARPGAPREPAVVLSVSAGGATFPVECEEADELVRTADARCLEAKREGKDRIRLGTPVAP